MKNMRIIFELYEGNVEDLLTIYQEVSCHIIFDVNMGDNFLRNARMIAVWNRTTALLYLTYYPVI